MDISYYSLLPIMGVVRETSREKICNELGLETLEKKKIVQETMLLLKSL